MDFFEHQDRARRKTVQLVLLFLLGIVATLIIVNLVCFIGYWLVYNPESVSHTYQTTQVPSLLQNFISESSFTLTQQQSGLLAAWQSWWGSNLNWQVSLGVVAAVVIGTVFRYIELAGGGEKVAQWAGAKPVSMDSKNSDVRQLINVCEEMAIAAGMAVPALYVMEREQNINAFVAGYNADDAVLVVTQGALEKLNRDQLQGVIGHEYSHILNGDMRLNVRLMALLAGLVMIGQMGRFLIHTQFGARSSYSSRRSDGRSAVVFIAIGAVLTLVGYIGVLVSRMIKAAVSRQREYLADASSVQFTRNPDGLAGALYEINELQNGSQLNHQHAEDMSHFCFAESVAFSGRLATHPPLADRIKRIAPQFLAKEKTRRRQQEPAEQSVQRTAPPAFEAAMAAAGIASMVAQVTPDHVQYAQSLYQHIPEQLKNLVHQSAGARSYIYSQIMLASPKHQQAIVNIIKQQDPSSLECLQQMWRFSKAMDAQLRIPVLELTMPTLKRMPEPDRLIFIDRLQELVNLDGKVDFIEWVSLSLIMLKLQPNKAQQRQKLSSKLKDFEPEVTLVLSLLVDLSPDKAKATAAFMQACDQLGFGRVAKTDASVEFSALSQALSKLDTISFMWRKVFLQCCADIVQSDDKIDFKEYEALRVIADCLGSPLPPLMVAIEAADLRDEPIPFEM